MQPATYVQAIADGAVDAIVVPRSFIGAIQERTGDQLVAWPAQNSQSGYYVIAARGDWIAGHRQQIDKVLRSLRQAETYIAEHPAEARAVVRERLGYTDDFMVQVWGEHNYSLSLDLPLVVAMEDEARWMIANGLTRETQVPDLSGYIHEDALKAAKPGAVTIIR